MSVYSAPVRPAIALNRKDTVVSKIPQTPLISKNSD